MIPSAYTNWETLFLAAAYTEKAKQMNSDPRVASKTNPYPPYQSRLPSALLHICETNMRSTQSGRGIISTTRSAQSMQKIALAWVEKRVSISCIFYSPMSHHLTELESQFSS